MIEKVKAASAFLKERISSSPESAVILGSGLGSFADSLEGRTVIPYEEIPHWPLSTAPGHGGRLVHGRLGDRELLVMQGRVHYYEGYPMEEVVFPVRVLAQLGVKNLVITNASGGVDVSLSPGESRLVFA